MANVKQQRRLAILFIAPAFVVYTLLVVFPSVRALMYSFWKWDGFSEPEWTGLTNFEALFAPGSLFIAALSHNVFLAVVSGVIILALALLFAALIHRGMRGAAIYRVTFFFPNVVAAVAVALLWVLIYSTTEFGLLNGILYALRDSTEGTVLAPVAAWIVPESMPFPFTDSRYLLWSIIPVLVWVATGFYMVLFLAAMQNVPEEYYEAARIEGAGGISQFWHVTLPLIREVIVVGVVFLLISSLKTFDIIWIMENQWPGPDTHVMATLMYQKVFTEYNVGYGAAVAVVIFLLVFAATLVTLRFSRKEALEY